MVRDADGNVADTGLDGRVPTAVQAAQRAPNATPVMDPATTRSGGGDASADGARGGEAVLGSAQARFDRHRRRF